MFGSEVNTVPIFGVPLTIFNYSSQVFPPLLMAAVLGPLYKLLKKLIPDNVQLLFVPFLAMLIMMPLTAFLIGPIGVYAGAAVADVLRLINDFSPFIFAIVIPLAYPFMVLVGCLIGGVITGFGGGLKTSAFVFTSLLTIPAFDNIPLYVIAISASFFTAMFLVVIFDYRSPEERAAGRADLEPLEPAPIVVIVGDEQGNQAMQWLAALGEDNVNKVDLVAGTRLRIEVTDPARVDLDALAQAGLPGAVQVAPNVWHLVAGPEAEQYATTMNQRLAGAALAETAAAPSAGEQLREGERTAAGQL